MRENQLQRNKIHVAPGNNRFGRGPRIPELPTSHQTPGIRGADDENVAIDPTRNVPALLTFIANKLSVSAAVTYKTALDVSLIEWRILVHLAIEPNLSGARICEIVGLDKASVSRAANALASRGLITVSAADGRRNSLALTPAGRRLHNKGMPLAREREERLLSGLTVAERETLIDLLTRTHAQLDKVAALRIASSEVPRTKSGDAVQVPTRARTPKRA